MLRYRYDSSKFASEQLRIVTKEGKILPLILNKGQRKILEAIERQRSKGIPVRICLLKARQFGGSTFFEAEIYKDTQLNANRSSMIVAHDLESARHLREINDTYYEYYGLPKVKKKRESDKWWKFLHFTPEGRRAYSNLRIDTAEELSTGHSFTLHNLHLSEIQNWRNATVLVKGLFPTVPSNPDTMIFMEGTGSGVGDFWYEFWNSSFESSWESVFVAWYELEDSTLRFSDEEERSNFEAKLTGEEKLLLRESVTLEQLHWRRKKINDEYRGDIDGFRQQYPSSPEEAFLSSGRPVFSVLNVREKAHEAREGQVGDLEWRMDSSGRRFVVFSPNPQGYWIIHEEPVKGSYMYAGGFDVAEGLAVVPEWGNRGGDKSSGKIFRRDTKEFVGRINVHLDPDEFAKEIEKACMYWPQLGALVENNPGGSGNVVIRDLKGLPNVYLLKTVTLDKVHDTRIEQFGWDTNKESKREMVDELIEWIREKRLIDFDKEFWYQCSTYVRDSKGKTNAQSRKFDDLVVAGALTLQAHKIMPAWKKEEKPEEKKIITRDMDVPENWKRDEKVTQESVMEKTYAET